MAVFAYKAKTKDGKVMKGKIEGSSKNEALDKLNHMDFIVFDVGVLNTVLNKDITFRQSLKPKDFIIFLRQFSSLMNAGILLVDALDILAAQASSMMLKEALEELSEQVRQGVALSEALSKRPKLFPDLLVHMIHSAEVSGRMEEVLQQMADYYEKQYRIKQKISTAMTYPLVVGTLAIFITAFLLVFIVPIFGDMFASMGSELPAITQTVLTMSGLVQRYWWVAVVLMILLVTSGMQLKKKNRVAYVFDLVQLKIPIIGSFLQKTVLARMTQTLSSLINSSVPILEAIEVTSQVVGNRIVEDVLLQAKNDVENGESLAKPMLDHWFFPPLIIQMIQVGESSGELDEMLKKVSEIYDQEVEEASDKLQVLIEPVMILFLSVVVGVIVLSIVVPMFSMFETFG